MHKILCRICRISRFFRILSTYTCRPIPSRQRRRRRQSQSGGETLFRHVAIAAIAAIFPSTDCHVRQNTPPIANNPRVARFKKSGFEIAEICESFPYLSGNWQLATGSLKPTIDLNKHPPHAEEIDGNSTRSELGNPASPLQRNPECGCWFGIQILPPDCRGKRAEHPK